MSIKKNSRKGTTGSDAQQKTEPASANSQRISRRRKAKKVTANRKLQKAKRENEAESSADQKIEHPTRGADHKQQSQERLNRRRQSIIDSEDHTPPSKTPTKNVTTSAAAAAAAASPTDQSKASSSTPRARHTEENLKPTNQISPNTSPLTRRSSLERLIKTAPGAHKDGYRAMKYSYRLIHLTHTIQSENPGISVFDGLFENLNTVETELDRIIEQSRKNYDAEVDQDRISPPEKDGKRGKRVVSEDGSGAPVNTRARKRARK